MRISLVLVAALFTQGCAGPPAPQPIEGEPICPDFEVGATRAKMQGSLRFPVSLVIKEKETILSRSTLVGLRTDSDTKSRALLRDEDAEVTLEWGQCENERAPRAVAAVTGKSPKNTAAYECGKVTSYKTDKLAIRKGDPSSRVIHFEEPPNAACWTPEAPPAPTVTPDAGAPTEDAGPPDAGPEPPAASASAAAPPADTGAKKKNKKKLPPPPG